MAVNLDFAVASSDQITKELGRRIERIRLSRNLTQAELAADAGVNPRTILRLEKDGTATLDTFVRVLMALALGPNLEALIPEAEIRPVERLRHRGRERQRATSRPPRTPPSAPFRWGDET